MGDALQLYRLLIADVYELAGLSRRTSEDIARQRGQTTSRWHVLSVLSDGPRTVPSAARRLGLARQSVQRVVGDLVASGQVEAVNNPEHARSPLISLTDSGRETVAQLFVLSDQSRTELLARAGIDETRLTDARSVIRALVEALREPE